MAFCFALNHLLQAEPWARARLAPFAGESVELRAPPLPRLRFTIAPEGLAQAGGGEPSLALTLKPELLAGLARGEEHALRAVEVSGNAQLATELMLLARHLRWDFEEDLARLLGDAAAHRLAGVARDLAAWHADAARRIAAALADYATDESRLLVRRGDLAALAGELAGLRDAIERLDKRIERLG
ncbi:MAG: SCP2 sterol-binding domain-containing protein [Betaproteobacteria bacterium]|nr:SCP2 sterol-binding domain-containing protein [Betaproteobacteria bacterium]